MTGPIWRNLRVSSISRIICTFSPAGEEPFVLAVCTTVDLSEAGGAALVAGIAHDVWSADHAGDVTAVTPGHEA